MSEFFVGQIMLTGFGFAPKQFAQCNGQLLPIHQNTALFSLLGTYYGGNGSTNFALPDLRGRAATGFGSSADPAWSPAPFQLGQVGGSESVTLLPGNLPTHAHAMNASTNPGNSRIPAGRLFATSTNTTAPAALYGPADGTTVAQNAQTVGSAGGTQPHPNMQPYGVVNFCIALGGTFPSRN